MKLFPDEPILLGTMASAHLSGIEKREGYLVGRFELRPRDTVEYLDRIESLQGCLGSRYEPVPGTWASFVVPDDRDDIDLLVGLDARLGRAMVGAYDSLRLPKRVLVPESMIRTLAMGYIARVED